MNLALCCISNVLAERGLKFQTMTFTRFANMRFNTPQLALKTLGERILNNFVVTNATIQHCADTGIAGYRLSSSLTPVLDHPDVNLTLRDLPNWSDIHDALATISATIKRTGVRVSAHPSEFISLTSESSTVINNSIRDLTSHAELFDLLDLPSDYRSPLNIHCRQDGYPAVISQRFLHNFNRLPYSVRSRLVLEVNDNANGTWSISNLFKYFHLTSGIPITYDSLHRQFCNHGNDDITDFNLAYSTWPTVPLFHYSEGINGTRKHADMPTGIPQSYGKHVFFDVELKSKDLAIYSILKNHEHLSKAN
jgi:UV DNA damage endonuclease